VIRKIRKETEDLPRFYGIAWRRPLDFDAVCYPVPLNLIFRFFRAFWYFVSCPNILSAQERMENHLQIQFEIRVQEEVDRRVEKASEMAATMLRLDGVIK